MRIPIGPKDVVRILVNMGDYPTTGVVLRVSDESICVVIKGQYFGTWFNVTELKRIGRVRE